MSTPVTLEATASALWNSRLNGELYSGNGQPVSLDAAYDLQAAAVSSSRSDTCGYKVGATTHEVMELLALDEPFFGPLHSRYNQQSGAEVPVFTCHQPRIEAEFVIALKNDLKRGETDLSLDKVRAAIDWIAPGFEFIGARFKDVADVRGFCTVADFGSNLDFVVGDKCYDWQNLDMESLPVSLSINESVVATGHSGMSIVERPDAIVAWLVNHPRMRQQGLLEGQMISCGTCTGAVAVSPGDLVTADYGVLGTLASRMVAAR